jgi:two-component system cell cycle sensor histidine kinase/response regulator CckA
VLVNLVVNARDAMPTGGTVTIRTANLANARGATAEASALSLRPGNYVHLSVTDTGVGMTPETQSRVFEPFFTTKEWGKGTGLGLSTVYGIVHQSGGEIRVVSAVGGGATFDIYLPQASDLAESPSPAPTRSRPAAGAAIVLVVDDDAAIRNAVRRILVAGGYDVIEAASGAEGMQAAERAGSTIGVVLCDLVLPGMTGGDVAVAIRRRLPDVRVLLMSGYNDASGASSATAASGFAFLEKPFTGPTLLDAIAQLLASGSPAGR